MLSLAVLLFLRLVVILPEISLGLWMGRESVHYFIEMHISGRHLQKLVPGIWQLQQGKVPGDFRWGT